MDHAPFCIIAGAALLLSCSGAQARPPQCNTRDNVLRQLLTKYQEEPVAFGVLGTGRAIEVLTSPGGATWTIIISDPESGISCLLSVGEGWRAAKRPEGPET